MAREEIQWKSDLLARETTMRVIVPQIGTPPFCTLYLLHALNEDSSAWLHKTGIQTLVRHLPLFVVMPDGDRGFFTDNEDGPPYARYVGEEVLEFVERNFPVRRERSGRAIGGVSMGGYGALRIGLGYCDRFCSIHSHSGSLDRGVEFNLDPAKRSGLMKQRPDSFVLEMRRIFGESPTGTKHDVLRLAQEAKQRDQLPGLWIECGVEDYLLNGTRAFHRDLEAANIPHVYREIPGVHDSPYQDGDLKAALEFHVANLGLVRP